MAHGVIVPDNRQVIFNWYYFMADHFATDFVALRILAYAMAAITEGSARPISSRNPAKNPYKSAY